MRAESCGAASRAAALSPGGLPGRAAGLLRRGGAVPAPPPPATIATGMMSMPSFSYAVPNARRTERWSDVLANRVSTSISTASSCSQPGHVGSLRPAIGSDREPATRYGWASAQRARAPSQHPSPEPTAGTHAGADAGPVMSRLPAGPARGQQPRRTGVHHGKYASASHERRCVERGAPNRMRLSEGRLNHLTSAVIPIMGTGNRALGGKTKPTAGWRIRSALGSATVPAQARRRSGRRRSVMGMEPHELKNTWLHRALQRAGIEHESWRPGRGVDENRRVVEAVYGYYGGLFLEHP